jgi:membrane dipeptidase
MKFLIVFLCILFSISVYSQEYRNLHKFAVVADLHTDVLQNVMRGADIAMRSSYGHVDLVRLKEGGVDVQFFAIWPDPKKYLPNRMYKHSMHMINLLEQLVEQNRSVIGLAQSTDDIIHLLAEQKIAACIGLEGGTAIENDLSKLQNFYDRGVRYMGLTWNDSPDWATSAKDETSEEFSRKSGLTDFGRAVIQKMNELGMMIDVSHCGEKTFWDVMKTTQQPVIASHSAAHALRWHHRNLKDDQIKAIAEKGGVVCINFYPGYLDYSFAKRYEAIRQDSKPYLDSIRISFAGDRVGYDAFRERYYSERTAGFRTGIEILFRHIDYVVTLVGDDYVGLGSDFDGISVTPLGLNDVSQLPLLTKLMLEKGYSQHRIRKILGGNFMRVFNQVETKSNRRE